MTPHFYATGSPSCLYCAAPAARRGEPCRFRADREEGWTRATGQPYLPELHLRAEVRRRGLRVVASDEHHGAAPMRVWRVLRGEEVVVEAAFVVAEIGARVAVERVTRLPG